ncbi:MAG TPA: M23 family metallopeptidase, partial [Gaiellaceae bacterium]|nr:M23 family metallopeptidase [Gaiellaceae bacterium]
IMAAMVVRSGVLALVGLLGALGSLLIARTSLASAGPTDSTTTTTTAASTTVGTSVGTTTGTSTSAVPATPPVAVPVRPTLARDCVTAGGVMLLVPGRKPVVLVADPAHSRASSGPFVYPRSGALVSVASIGVRANGCSGSAQATVLSPSLFGGAVSAGAASLSAGTGPDHASLRGVRVAGKPTVLLARKRTPVAAWGYATKTERRPLGAGRELEAALAVHLLAPHGGLPRGAIVVVGFAVRARRTASAAPSRRRAAHAPRPKTGAKANRSRPQKRGPTGDQGTARSRLLARLQRAHKPLKITPPLGLSRYVFPVAGTASFTDTYGAARSDVSWHHGDDIFAPLGTPVVAVADGTLNRVGWEKLGGWRLWVRDRLGNEFYYAHLSGYTRAALEKGRIKAGTVLGFVGDTGDAFGTPFHLHFEIHPRSLLPLRYDGAVDPTSYLDHWAHLSHEHGSRPLHPHLPKGTARAQAIYVYKELLAARGLIRHRPPHLRAQQRSKGGGDFGSKPKPSAPKRPVRTRPTEPEKATNVSASTFTLEGVAIAFLAAPAALAATLFRRKR